MLTDRYWPVQIEIPMRVAEPTLPAAGAPVRVWWYYAAALDPYAVHMDLGGGNVWSVGRELVARGLRAPTGLGDVQVWPAQGRIWIALGSPDGRAVLSARSRDLAGFLATTYAWVPRGEEPEFLDWDAVVERILEEGRC